MADTTQVNVKLPVSMKRDWEDYVEENEAATSVSHLIRLAVQREISDEARGATEVELDSDEVDVDVELDGIHRRLDEMEDTLTEVRDTVNAMETGRLADENQIEEIADRIYDTMPRRTTERINDAPDLRPREVAHQLLNNARIEFEDRDRSIEDLAQAQNWDYGLVPVYQEYFGINDYEMQKALERVQDYSSRVHVIDDLRYTVVFEED